MNIQKIDNQTNFRAKFILNQPFKEVVRYAEKTNQLPVLDTALYKLSRANSGNIILLHGKNENSLVPMFSNFTLYQDGTRGYRDRRSVQNMINGASSPEEASFNAILELANFGRKFQKLFNVQKPRIFGTADDILEKYTTSKHV